MALGATLLVFLGDWARAVCQERVDRLMDTDYSTMSHHNSGPASPLIIMPEVDSPGPVHDANEKNLVDNNHQGFLLASIVTLSRNEEAALAVITGAICRVKANMVGTSRMRHKQVDALLMVSKEFATVESFFLQNKQDRLKKVLFGLFVMRQNIKSVIRNRSAWVSPRDRLEALNLIGLHLEECHKMLLLTRIKGFWPQVGMSEILMKRTAGFSFKCRWQGGHVTLSSTGKASSIFPFGKQSVGSSNRRPSWVQHVPSRR